MLKGIYFPVDGEPIATKTPYALIGNQVRPIIGGWINLGDGMHQFWPGAQMNDQNIMYDGACERLMNGSAPAQYAINGTQYYAYRLTGSGDLMLKKAGCKAWLCGGGAGGNYGECYSTGIGTYASLMMQSSGVGGIGAEANIYENFTRYAKYHITIGAGGRGSTALSQNLYGTMRAATNRIISPGMVAGGNTVIADVNDRTLVSAFGGGIAYDNNHKLHGSVGGGGSAYNRWGTVNFGAANGVFPDAPGNYYGSGVHTDYAYGSPYGINALGKCCYGGGGGATLIGTESTVSWYGMLSRYTMGGYGAGLYGSISSKPYGRIMIDATDGDSAKNTASAAFVELSGMGDWERTFEGGRLTSDTSSPKSGGDAKYHCKVDPYSTSDHTDELSSTPGLSNSNYGCGGGGGGSAIYYDRSSGSVLNSHPQKGGDGSPGVVYIFVPV